MGKSLKYVSLPDMYHLMDGLTFSVSACADVLDNLLVQFNKKSGVPDKIVSWNRKEPTSRPSLVVPGQGRLIIEIIQTLSKEKGRLCVAKLMESKGERELAPVVFFSMHSPTLDVPMRIEVPLRALIKGGRKLAGTYTVYLHALLTDDGQEFTYYGITKRGWNLRFIEHTTSALRNGSQRLFPLKMKELIEARSAQLQGTPSAAPKLAGIVTAVCAIGLDEDAALDAEEYLVDKYSLASKHTNGLNMIPGGREGIRTLHRLSLGSNASLVNTEDREALLDEYLQAQPQEKRAKPGVAAAWNDPAYAEAVICGRANRLDASQVRQIRYLAALGNTVNQIKLHVGALDVGQVSRVTEGRTYSRIK